MQDLYQKEKNMNKLLTSALLLMTLSAARECNPCSFLFTELFQTIERALHVKGSC